MDQIRGEKPAQRDRVRGRRLADRIRKAVAPILLTAGCILLGAPGATAQVQTPSDTEAVIDLTPERMVELLVDGSYRVQFLNMGMEQTRQRLRAESARLRSSVSMDLSVPDFRSISDYEFTGGQREIVHENSRRWEAQLSVRQPVILFGYPTNGHLSLNNRVYRYTQIGENGSRDIDYYNRYFVRYTQPLFQPNSLRNDLEEAELDLEEQEIDFRDDIVELVDDAQDDYFRLFDEIYQRTILEEYVERLEQAETIAQDLVQESPERSLDVEQIQVEVTNARENVGRADSDVRRQFARLRTDLDLPDSVTFELDPVIEFEPVEIDVEEATQFALERTPRMRQLDISRRQNEIRLEETEGRNSFRVDLEFTYGREASDAVFNQMWGDPRNTYTIDVNAYVPIWDWGERDARIHASRISLDRTQLRIEQARDQIESNVENEVQNVVELQDRLLSLEENLERARGIADESFDRYEGGVISALDLLQALQRESDTAENFLDTYIAWQESLQQLQEMTYYDFEYDMPLLERFGIDIETVQQMTR